eukprot:g3870.t1
MTSKKHNVTFEYTPGKSMKRVLFDSIPNLWNQLKIKYEWKTNGKTLRKREDLVYADEKHKTGIPLNRLNFEDTMERGGIIFFKTKEQIYRERILKHKTLLDKCVRASAFPENDERVKVEWKCFIAISLVRASSNNSRSSNYLRNAQTEMDCVLEKMEEARDILETRGILWTTSFKRALVYDTKKLRKDIAKLPRFLHFIGHGSSYQLHLDNENGTELKTVDGSYILELIESTASLECVVLNCCNSFELGKEIAEYVPYVICWQGRDVENVTDEGPRGLLVSAIKKQFEIEEAENLNDLGVFQVNGNKVEMEDLKDLINEMKKVVKNGKSMNLIVRKYSHSEMVERCVIDSEKSLDIDILAPSSVVGPVCVNKDGLKHVSKEYKRVVVFGDQTKDIFGIEAHALESISGTGGDSMKTLRAILTGAQDKKGIKDRGRPLFLHFVGHGVKKTGPLFKKENGKYGTASVIKHAKENIKPFLLCVVVNCCHSYELACEIAEFVPYVVCWLGDMDGTVGDEVCFKFTDTFYDALLNQVNEKDSPIRVREAYRSAVSQLKEKEIKEWRPRLLMHKNSSEIIVKTKQSDVLVPRIVYYTIL